MTKPIPFSLEVIAGRALDDYSPLSEMYRVTRSRVLGGWIVRFHEWFAPGESQTSIFVPDPGYEWEIAKP